MKRRKRTNSTSSDTLPQEMCTEILSRLPAKPLLRFRCVSKLWCSLIDDPYLISTHMKNSPKNNQETPRLLVVEPPEMVDGRQLCTLRRSETFRKISSLGLFVSWYEHYQVAGYINGVICMKKYKMETQVFEVFLWNPSIRKCLNIPLPRIAFVCARMDVDLAFGFDPITNDYKVIASLYVMGGVHIPQFIELYSLQKGFWTAIPFQKGPRCWSKCGPKAYLDGITYWIGADVLKATSKGKYTHLVSFNARNDEFNSIELPDCEDVDSPTHERFPVILGGESIALMEIYRNHSYIWVQGDSGLKKGCNWSKRYSIELRLYSKCLYLMTDGELLFGEDRGVKSYNIETKEIKVLAKSYKLSPVFTGVYKESLALLEPTLKNKGIRPLRTFPETQRQVPCVTQFPLLIVP